MQLTPCIASILSTGPWLAHCHAGPQSPFLFLQSRNLKAKAAFVLHPNA